MPRWIVPIHAARRWLIGIALSATLVAVAIGEPVPPAGSSDASADHANAVHSSSSHEDPVTPLLLGLCIILFAAKVGGDLAVRWKQPAVLGELLAGVVIGNMTLFGFSGFEFLRMAEGTQAVNLPFQHTAITLDMMSRVGVVLLLFEVGLDSSVREIFRVGPSALAVASLGVVAPFLLGYGVGKWMLPEHSGNVHLFLGATLCATSVGITARVLRDLGKADTDVAKIVLGAAVIDDILGLLVLAVVQSLILHGSASVVDVFVISSKSVGFLVAAILVGSFISPILFRFATRMRTEGMLMFTGLAMCFLFAWSSSIAGLAPIVGAFAAGLIVHERHYRVHLKDGEWSLNEWVLPVSSIFVPIFFVLMGFHVDLRSFADPQVLILSLGLTVAAILGKQVCGLGVFQSGCDRISVGIGMIPRGEVGLIFAAIGRSLRSEGEPVISDEVFSAIVVMIMFTTLITPPLLSWALRRSEKRNRNANLGILLVISVIGILSSASVACSDDSPRAAPIYAKALEPGDTIAIIAPSGPPEAERIQLAADRLQDLGFQVRLPKSDKATSIEYLADSDAARAEELMLAFRDPDVDAIFPATGGYGVTRILDRLDYAAIRENPKILTGFSDLTALHFAIHQQTGLITFHSPNPTWGLGSDEGMTLFSQRWFWKGLRNDASVRAGNPRSGEHTAGYILRAPWKSSESDSPIDVLDPPSKPKKLSEATSGKGRGRLVGGNLTLVATLMGTPFEPDFRDAIVFLEDIGEAPYRIDRMLSTLRLAGKLDQARGFILGRFTRRDKEDTADEITSIDDVLTDYFASRSVPVVRDFPVGHVRDNVTLPFGAMCELDADQGSLTILVDPVVSSKEIKPR
jgi:muramoyltetrapeptide carboxypeptidase LdcA involved in peptidoglycan recycling/Kef-type K+ transport system membrane component KefB